MLMLEKAYNVLFIIFFWLIFGVVKCSIIIIPLFKRKMTIRKILYLDPFSIKNSAGHKYRVRLWMNELSRHGADVSVFTLIKNGKVYFEMLKRKKIKKFLFFSMIKRYFQIIKSLNYSVVIVRRELLYFNDYGNLFMDKLLLKLHENVILDFDDDLAASKKQPKKITTLFGRLLLEDGDKFNNSLRLYSKFIVASDYLKEKIIKENPTIKTDNILIIPTCVDYNRYPAKIYPAKIDMIVFGWIGGDHNYYLLDLLIPILNKLSDKHKFKLLVIGGDEYKRDVSFNLEFIPWSIETEVDSLYKIDIGLMPLLDDEESRGKGGFKLIQYMGLGIVSIASAITINCEIVKDRENSFLVKTNEDWITIFTEILSGEVNLQEMGKKAKEHIEKYYTFEANKNKYLDFVNKR